MIVDGREIAQRILGKLRAQLVECEVAPHLTIFTCAPDFATQKFLALKKRRAEEVGIAHTVIEFPESITTDEVVTSIQRSAIQTNGIIVQLPFPKHIDTKAVLAAVPPSCDVDVLTYDGTQREVLPPVIGAIVEIAKAHDGLFASAHVVVVGEGRLVGAPAAIWARRQGAQVTVVNAETPNKEEIIQSADILILGAGQPGFVTADMVRDGVLVFDAGTSEYQGGLVGDAHESVAQKAALFTPVPGGIGPITIAILLRNLLVLTERL